MKLPHAAFDLTTQLLEFDVWITPSLGEITETEKFREQLNRVVWVFQILDDATHHFSDAKDCQPRAIAEHFVDRLQGLSDEQSSELLESLAAVLFLVTGRSDNNAKCQLPLFLRDHARWRTLPICRRTAKSQSLAEIAIPRELKAEKYLGFVVGLRGFPEQQQRLLSEFVTFLLATQASISQLWSIGFAFHALMQFGKERELLTPLVVFQVRGSIAASGGHDPEELLRKSLLDWGLIAGIDFNTSDVRLDELHSRIGQRGDVVIREKSRAYDFVFPFQTPGWTPQLFVQCQFYAGDSGSVSHKNVDQTSTSRATVRHLIPNARFLEYVDGAGYFSSLNGDLKTLLSMPTTKSFFQIRSAAVRLRRELQAIGFLAPIEIEQAIWRCGGHELKTRRYLEGDGYSAQEIDRSLRQAVEAEIVCRMPGGKLQVRDDRRSLVRRYVLLDLAATLGTAPEHPSDQLRGALLIPGYGPLHGVKLDVLAKAATTTFPALKDDWSQPEVILADIRWLCEQGLAMS